MTPPPPDQWYRASRAPPARHTSPAYSPPFWTPIFGWLLHYFFAEWPVPKVTMNFIVFYFLLLDLLAKTMGQHPPTQSLPKAPLL